MFIAFFITLHLPNLIIFHHFLGKQVRESTHKTEALIMVYISTLWFSPIKIQIIRSMQRCFDVLYLAYLVKPDILDMKN